MNIESVKAVYFSPTKTTKAVVEGIVHGWTRSAWSVRYHPAGCEDTATQNLGERLLIVGVPV